MPDDDAARDAFAKDSVVSDGAASDGVASDGVASDGAGDGSLPESVGARFRFIFVTPWWRLAWFLGGVAWCAVLNIAFASTVGSDSWLGTLSVLPLYFFAGWTVIRLYRRGRVVTPVAKDEPPVQG